MKTRVASDSDDAFGLSRFITAQEHIYDTVLAELRNGQKRSHCMWYIFPQICGLEQSEISKRFAIESIEEAHQYLKHPILGTRLLVCTDAVLAI